ncbi:hypothetical protein [Thermomonospora cellulosilytica]|uniref:Uncharacterized protein n=1 Tax=Thermomonospora cellulosilytica TaxID=1411118 RepID=A0A7W3MXG1_9ACTN|nr:hypothetical protein [Thermomonospora cellulosilytica]MBA9003656.1 hypothetical protein [Thermomonospora cellulosilytica]
MQAYSEWYRFELESDGGPFPVLFRPEHDYSGTGGEIGGGNAPSGAHALHAVAQGIADAISAQASPAWAHMRVVKVEAAQPARMVEITPPPQTVADEGA